MNREELENADLLPDGEAKEPVGSCDICETRHSPDDDCPDEA